MTCDSKIFGHSPLGWYIMVFWYIFVLLLIVHEVSSTTGRHKSRSFYNSYIFLLEFWVEKVRTEKKYFTLTSMVYEDCAVLGNISNLFPAHPHVNLCLPENMLA